MGLFDGAANGKGSCSEIAKSLGFPVILLVDCASMGQSVAALVYGFLNHDPELSIAGLILNRVGSDRHEAMLHEALSSSPIPILGAIRRNASLSRPSRHLGLIQARQRCRIHLYLPPSPSRLGECGCKTHLLLPACRPTAITRSRRHLSARRLSRTTCRSSDPSRHIQKSHERRRRSVKGHLRRMRRIHGPRPFDHRRAGHRPPDVGPSRPRNQLFKTKTALGLSRPDGHDRTFPRQIQGP